MVSVGAPIAFNGTIHTFNRIECGVVDTICGLSTPCILGDEITVDVAMEFDLCPICLVPESLSKANVIGVKLYTTGSMMVSMTPSTSSCYRINMLIPESEERQVVRGSISVANSKTNAVKLTTRDGAYTYTMFREHKLGWWDAIGWLPAGIYATIGAYIKR